jgi:hypothetical protein
MSGSMLTLLAMPKPFHGHVGVIQCNAIRSWTKLVPRPEIFLFGEEEGTAQIAEELRIGQLRDIQRNEFGTPLLNDLLRRAKEVTSTPLLGYINSDIILLQEFQEAVATIHTRMPRFLGVTHRWEIDLRSELDFEQQPRLVLSMLPRGASGHHTAIDAFVFNRDMYNDVPPLVIGRAWFDQWLIKDARHRKIPVVDLTRVARAIHQQHEYGHISGGQNVAYGGEEAGRNLDIYGGVPHAFTLLDATHELLHNQTIRKLHFRRKKFKLREWLWRNFIQRTAGIRHRLGLRRSEKAKSNPTNSSP